MNKTKIAISLLCYPMTMAHYFWRAFERRDDVELFVLGPYFDNFIPWNNGMMLPKRYVKIPDLTLPQSSAQFMPKYSSVLPFMPWKPDLFLQIDAGWHFSDKPDAGVVAHIQTDPHVLKQFYKPALEYADVRFCMQNCYKEDGEELLPYAYDPEIHFHEDRQKEYDACLIGLHYDHRNLLVKRLRDRGLNVYYSIGEIYDKYREKYNQSHVAISWSSLKDLPSRVWEAWGMNLPLVSNRVPDLNLFANDGEHYLGFDDVDEAEQQVLKLLNNKQLRLDIAQKGHDNAKNETWDTRAQTILEVCKLT